MTKNENYYYDNEAINELGANGKPRNKRSVWDVKTEPFQEAHFATFPPKLIEPCILSGSKPGDTVIDPFFGSGTTGLVAALYGRNSIGIEIKQQYIDIAQRRLSQHGIVLEQKGEMKS